MTRPTPPASGALNFDDAVVALATARGFPEMPRLESAARLRALREAGTAHVYADTASLDELRGLIASGERGVIAEIDGNTANQPLVEKVLEGYLEEAPVADWAKALRGHSPELSHPRLLAILYAVVCGRIASDIVRAFAGHRSWEVSLQLHMGLVDDAEAALQVARQLRRMVASALVKVPFAPHAPQTLLVARELERASIPVNFTSTFSARQVVVAALLCDATRTNVFMGRLNQGLRAELLGEHVALEAQRALRRLREGEGLRTQLIVASIRSWETLPRTAGCDVFTASCDVLRAFLEAGKREGPSLSSQLETSYEDRLGIPADVEQKLGTEAIARLFRVEPELVEFLRAYRRSDEFRGLSCQDGETLVRRFEEAGFGDFFHAPGPDGWEQIERGKTPDLDAPITGQVALDTLYSLMADADFAKHQAEMDAVLEERLGASR
jgi:transaldolase